MAPTTGVFHQRDRGFLGRAGWADEEVGLPCLRQNSWNAQSTAWGRTMSELRAHG